MTNNEIQLLYLTPYLHSKRGNATTARRMKEILAKCGVHVTVYAYEEMDHSVQPLINKADIVHALHVKRTAEWIQKFRVQLNRPLVLTSGGTDINVDFNSLEKSEVMKQLLYQASALTVFTRDAKEKVVSRLPELRESVRVIPQSVSPSAKKHELDLALPEASPSILLPAGLRKVKDVLYLMDELDNLSNSFPNMQFILVGEELEQNVKKEVNDAENTYSWFTYHEPVEPEKMSGFYKWADVILNTSLSEGQPISLLEGMAAGVPALARDIPGNRSVIIPGYNGELFSNPTEFGSFLYKLFKSESVYNKYSYQAREYIRTYHNPDVEANAYITLYKNILTPCKHK